MSLHLCPLQELTMKPFTKNGRDLVCFQVRHNHTEYSLQVKSVSLIVFKVSKKPPVVLFVCFVEMGFQLGKTTFWGIEALKVILQDPELILEDHELHHVTAIHNLTLQAVLRLLSSVILPYYGIF